MKLFKAVAFAGALVSVLPLVAQGPAAATTSARVDPLTRWRVRVTNLTPSTATGPGAQPLSPPVVAVHREGFHVWQHGSIISSAATAVAEDANNAVLVSALSKTGAVSTASTAPGGPIPGGGSVDVEVQVPAGSVISILTMLVNTNDAFTGVDSLRPTGRRALVRTVAFDAGTEVNNERRAFVPGPCCGNFFVRAPEGDVVRWHRGITGRGDLDARVYRWSGPVAAVALTRID